MTHTLPEPSSHVGTHAPPGDRNLSAYEQAKHHAEMAEAELRRKRNGGGAMRTCTVARVADYAVEADDRKGRLRGKGVS